ncbi:NAD(P)-dependent glycerol-3-phosphate dehydrogenase [Akkermansiaceae bacterium]|nr:NAD(P)-dependent glycerol-3-phosphate dehydrogenase [Akkermansiaceae bacterium]
MPTTFHKASIIGAGSWGSALSFILSSSFDNILIHARSEDKVKELNEKRTNLTYLGDRVFPENVSATTNFYDLKDSELILFVVPTSAMRATAEQMKKTQLPESTILVSCSKGIERGSGLRMSQILKEFFPNNPIAVHSGPTHAEEVVKGLAGCAVVASDAPATLPYLQKAFSTPYFRTYTSDDIAGIELGGALKNVFAIAAGMSRGIELGDNSIAALVTRGLAEMTRLGTALGGRAETFSGLSGVGDLMVTCYSEHSRNNRVGYSIGRGATCEDACKALGMVAEGVPNTLSIYESAKQVNIETPIIDAVYQVLYENKPVNEALKELLSRELRSETE